MSVSLRSTPTIDNSFGTSGSIAKPTCVVGDVLVWSVSNFVSGGTAAINTPSGFTLVDSITIDNGVTFSRCIRQSVFIRVVDGSEGSSFTVTGSSTGHASGFAGIMSAWAGVDNTVPITPVVGYSTNAGNATGTTITATGISGAQAGGMLLGSLATWEIDRGPLGGFTGIANLAGDGMTLCDLAIASSGATGNKTCSCSSTETWTVFLIALNPAAGGAAIVSPNEQSPLPKQFHSPIISAWEPLPSLPVQTTFVSSFSTPPLPRNFRVESYQSWEPLPALIPQVVTVGVFSSSPQSAKLRSPVTDNWTPLPAIAAGPGWGFSPTISIIGNSPRIDNWEPIPVLISSGLQAISVDIQSPIKLWPKVRVDNWDPIPGLGFAQIDTQAPIKTWAKVRVDNWEPIPDLPTAAIQFVSVDTQSPIKLWPKTRIDNWEPIPGLIPPPLQAISVDIQPPIKTWPKPKIDNWEPLGDLPQVSLTPTVDIQVIPQSKTKSKTVEGWNPLSGLNKPIVDTSYPIPSQRRTRVENWNPIGSLPNQVTDVFSQSLSVSNRRVRVDNWNPIPNLIPLISQKISVDINSPLSPRRVQARVEHWCPIPDLIPPIPVVASKYIPLMIGPIPVVLRLQDLPPGYYLYPVYLK